MRWHLTLTFCALCATTAGAVVALADPGLYVVRKGDSLSVIAQRFGCPVEDLVQHNRLADETLAVGQELKIARPFARTRSADVTFRRPFAKKGRILEKFGPRRQGKILVPRSGVKMACPVGAVVTAPAHAVVRYVGWMDEYGLLVILEHGGGYHTVFAPLDPAAMRVTLGSAVLAGEPLGVTAAPPQKGGDPYLHLELRKDEKAIDPARLVK